MTDRKTLDQMNSNDLDALYDRLDRIRDAAHLHRQGLLSTADLYAVIDAGSEPGPAATQATDTETTIRVFAALHRSAEQDVTRVIEAVETGPPSGMAIPGEWESGWDAAMDAVRAALTPPADQTKEQGCGPECSEMHTETGRCEIARNR